MQPIRNEKPLLVSIEMGYGHMRAAHALGEALGVEVLRVDRAPLAGPAEVRQWERTRRSYEGLTRLSQLPTAGRPLRTLLERLTDIPQLYALGDQRRPTLGSRLQEGLIARAGIGRGLVDELRASGRGLLTTYFTPAIAADRAGCEPVWCVVTDADINRVWAPFDPGRSRLHYLVPSRRAMRRLRAYGVAPDRIHETGFPLPPGLLGGPDLGRLKANLAARLVRLDPSGTFRRQMHDELGHFLGPLGDKPDKPPLLVYAVGGAGAQAHLARRFLPGLRRMLAAGRLRLLLVAGVRREVADAFSGYLAEAGLEQEPGGPVEILVEDDLDTYLDRFHRALAGADILWTKPSEMTFFGALGLPLVFAKPVGEHERFNRRWAIRQGAGIKQGDPRYAGGWLDEWLQDGTLARAAWSGYMHLPKFGLYRILETIGHPVG